MKTFIHTFSLTTYLQSNERLALETAYKENCMWSGDEKKWIIYTFNKDGILIKISNNSKKEKSMDKEHPPYKASIIINLHKLCCPDEIYNISTKPQDISIACSILERIFINIKEQCGVNLLKNTKLKRVDVTKDITTPSEEYTREIIRLSKLSVIRCGYKRWEPDESNKNVKWALENASMFYTPTQKVNIKLYNKEQDLKDHGYNIELDGKGILRFEISLLRPALKQLNYIIYDNITINELNQTLNKITNDGDVLLEKYIASPLYDGCMISKKLQDKYISIQYPGKEHRLKNMKQYRKSVNNKDTDFENMNSGKIYRTAEHFSNIKLSPVYTQPEFPYIPSFLQLLHEETDKDVLSFCFHNTKEKDIVFW